MHFISVEIVMFATPAAPALPAAALEANSRERPWGGSISAAAASAA